MKIFRLWGLLTFIGVLTLFALAWFLLAPSMIKSSIQEVGSEALGAKVEINSVDLSLFPLAISLNGLTAADPDAPMKNIFESKLIKFSVDPSALVWKKLVIDELNLSGIQTGTPRSSSGALAGGRKSEKAIRTVTAIEIPEISEADIKQKIEQADLLTVKRIQALNEQQKDIRQEWEKSLDRAEFEQRVETIKSEYERLSKRLKENKLNFIADRKDWKALKKQIDNERDLIALMKDKIKQDKAAVAKQIDLVKQAPQEDVNRVLSQYGLGNGVDGLVEKYLGPEYKPWVQRALALVSTFKQEKSVPQDEQVKDVVQMGDKVYFNDRQIFPELLIKKVIVNGNSDTWQLDGDGFNIGYLPWLVGQAAKLDLNFKGQGNAQFNLVSDWDSAENMETLLNSKIAAWPLKNMQLMQMEQGHWNLTSGILNADVKGKLTLNEINFSAVFNVASPKVEAPQGLKSWQQSLATAINQSRGFKIEVSASGSIEEPNIKVKSDLEDLFKQAIGDQVKQKADKLKQRVKQQITAKVGDMDGLNTLDGDFSNWQSQLGNKDELLKNLLGKIKL
ncbi:TIGR03545 family protein [Aliikangiella sp. IMCC44632]